MRTINKNLKQIGLLLNVLETQGEPIRIETINKIRKLIADEQNKNTKVYLNDVDEVIKDISDKAWSVEGLSDEEFMTEAERQGSVYSLEGYEQAFNDMPLTVMNSIIKIVIN